MLLRILCLLKDEDGATLVEYGIMLGLIFSICAASVAILGLATNGLFTKAKFP